MDDTTEHLPPPTAVEEYSGAMAVLEKHNVPKGICRGCRKKSYLISHLYDDFTELCPECFDLLRVARKSRGATMEDFNRVRKLLQESDVRKHPCCVCGDMKRPFGLWENLIICNECLAVSFPKGSVIVMFEDRYLEPIDG